MYLSKAFKHSNVELLVVSAVAMLLRFSQLGYSNYQEDELKALYSRPIDASRRWYLLSQRKGPLQFLVTYVTRFLNPGYKNELLTRLPFAVMGFAAVIAFYLMVKSLFGKRVAFFASLFFASNGFLVAFSRIAQYQSGVICFSMLCLLFLSLAYAHPRFKIWGVYLALLSWAVAILFHYDGLTIAPFVCFLLGRWLLQSPAEVKTRCKHAFVASGIGLGILGCFYVPFILQLDPRTLIYWTERIKGAENWIHSSVYLFKVYQPLLALPVYIILAILGLFSFLLPLVQMSSGKLDFFQIETAEAAPLRTFFLVLWFSLPYLFLEGFVQDPGTHIYTYLIPLFIFMGAGLAYLEALWKKGWNSKNLRIGRLSFRLVSGVVIGFLFLQSWMVFVDHDREYPWEPERFLFWTLPQYDTRYKPNTFGFPYNRDWAGMQRYIAKYPEVSCYLTNEKRAISDFYISLPYKPLCSGMYFYVYHPQSLSVDAAVEARVKSKIDQSTLIDTLTRNGEDYVKIYVIQEENLR